MPINVIFFGTPVIAVPALRALAALQSVRVNAVFTQPAARRSRRSPAESCEVAVAARELGFETHEVASVNEGEAYNRLAALSPDLIAVVSFGQILKQRVLALPRLGCLNFHPSMLPKFRGAAPIQRAVMAGVRTTGLTIMRLVKKLDAGPILLQRPWEIGGERSAEQLMAEAADLGAQLLCEVVEKLATGEIVPERAQNDAEATFAPPLTRLDGLIDFRREARALCDQVRGVQPWPRAEVTLVEGSKRVIVHEAWVVDGSGSAGEVMGIDRQGVVVACGAGALRLTRVQLEGKSVVNAHDLANGLRLKPGARFALPELP